MSKVYVADKETLDQVNSKADALQNTANTILSEMESLRNVYPVLLENPHPVWQRKRVINTNAAPNTHTTRLPSIIISRL